MAVKASLQELQRVISPAVDPVFYRKVYDDIETAGVSPLAHYARTGWREGRDPAPWFCTGAYLEANPDVARARVEPLHHYLTRGFREGREVAASPHAAGYLEWLARGGAGPGWAFDRPAERPSLPAPVVGGGSSWETAEEEMALLQGHFDAAFYLGVHPDIAAAATDPLRHFVMTGWREGRDPTPRFSVGEYLELYPDIAQAGINPFVHYVRTGRHEGRMPRSERGFRYGLLAGLRTVGERVEEAQRASAGFDVLPAAAFQAVVQMSRTGLRDLHITFSHDDYAAHVGGVQLCIQREAARIGALGHDHLHLHPAAPWPVIRAGEEAGLGVMLNGRPMGVFGGSDVARGLTHAAGAGQRSFAIHSLLGHSVDEVCAIVGAAGLEAGFFWLHDFASLCAGFHLMRNDVQDCAAPPPDSAACGVCIYGAWRGRHLAEHERLFRRLRLTAVSPSQPTLDTWRAGWDFPAAGEVVLPHARLKQRCPAPGGGEAEPFRIAFAGLPAAHKGWPLFRALLLRHEDDSRYAFIHLGGRTEGGLPVTFREVVATAAQPQAMQAALEAVRADAVLIWPLCRETFSFTAYEAAAAGAAVITGPDSGNVAAFVRDSGHGVVLPDEDALMAAFESGKVRELARRVRRPMLWDMEYSGLSADLLAAAAA